MDIRQLHYFLTLCEEMNYTRAAQRLFLSRQALRQSISALEAEMCGPLFLSAHHKLALGFDALLVVSPEHARLFREAAWSKEKDKWLPSKDDGDFIQSLMAQVVEPGKFASWIAPPRVGIDNKPGDFEYVKIAA